MSRVALKARSMDRKMFNFLRSFLEEHIKETQSECRNAEEEEFISLEEVYKKIDECQGCSCKKAKIFPFAFNSCQYVTSE